MVDRSARRSASRISTKLIRSEILEFLMTIDGNRVGKKPVVEGINPYLYLIESIVFS